MSWNATKAQVVKSKVQLYMSTLNNEEGSRINNLTFYLKELEKENPKQAYRRK